MTPWKPPRSPRNPPCVPCVWCLLPTRSSQSRANARFWLKLLVQARGLEYPGQQVQMVSWIARPPASVGRPCGAGKLLDELKPVVAKLTDKNVRILGIYAENLALVDLDAAVNVLKGFPDVREMWHYAGNIAHRLSGQDPAAAERVLDLIKVPMLASVRGKYAFQWEVMACYRMARVDLPRAMRIADSLTAKYSAAGPIKKAHAYGVMAMALAEKDPAAAKAMLRQAFEQITAPRIDKQTAWPVAIALLGYSERIDPERTREYFWRALATHHAPRTGPFRGAPEPTLTDNAQLALVLALYGQFPALQAELVEPVFNYLAGDANIRVGGFRPHREMYAAMALVSPQPTITWYKEHYAQLSKDQFYKPWTATADAFAYQGNELHQFIAGQVFALWEIDKEDD